MVVGDVYRLRQQVKAMWTRNQAIFIVITLTLLGAGLRLYNIDAHSFNNDEVFSIWVAEHDISFIMQFSMFGGGDSGIPPFHSVLLRAFLLIGEQPLVLRLPSALAGTLTVWLTFRLAAYLFGLRVATLSTFLMAVAPLHIARSQLARAHTLASLWALFSLYFFARLLFQEGRGRDWIGLVTATAAALWTFHTTFLVVLFENVCIALIWLRRRLSGPMLNRWFVSQVGLGIVVLATLLSALSAVSDVKLEWLTRPGLQELVKSAILFSTGDPSYGPIGVTPARILSLMTIVGICTLGLWVFLQCRYHRRLDDEGRRVLFVVGASMVPWLTVFAISQVRPIYKERYFLFIMPPLFILFAWIFIRARHRIISSSILLALIGITGSALFVYYTAPAGEQWREAVAYMRRAYQSDDLVVISPGHYGRPFAYYFHGSFPPDLATLAYRPALVVEDGEFRALNISPEAEGARIDDPALATAQRVWLVSGYAPVDPVVLLWADQNFETLHTGEFVGACVRLLQRTKRHI